MTQTKLVRTRDAHPEADRVERILDMHAEENAGLVDRVLSTLKRHHEAFLKQYEALAALVRQMNPPQHVAYLGADSDFVMPLVLRKPALSTDLALLLIDDYKRRGYHIDDMAAVMTPCSRLLPAANAAEVAYRLKGNGTNIPVIYRSGRGEDVEKMKPFLEQAPWIVTDDTALPAPLGFVAKDSRKDLPQDGNHCITLRLPVTRLDVVLPQASQWILYKKMPYKK